MSQGRTDIAVDSQQATSPAAAPLSPSLDNVQASARCSTLGKGLQSSKKRKTKGRRKTGRTQPNRGLTERQEKYVLAFVSGGVGVEGNSTRSALIAGYSTSCAQKRGWELRNNPRVMAKITRLLDSKQRQESAQAAITLAFIRSEHLRFAKIAEAIGTPQALSVATTNIELLGKTIGAYVSNLSIDVSKIAEFSKSEREDARRIASLLIRSESGSKAPSLDESETVKALPGAEIALFVPTAERAGMAELAENKIKEVARAGSGHLVSSTSDSEQPSSGQAGDGAAAVEDGDADSAAAAGRERDEQVDGGNGFGDPPLSPQGAGERANTTHPDNHPPSKPLPVIPSSDDPKSSPIKFENISPYSNLRMKD